MKRNGSRSGILRLLPLAALVVSGCGKSTEPAGPTSATPATSASGSPVPAPMTASDPTDVYRDLLEALNTKVALISTVQDIPSAKVVSDRFPEADRRHNVLADQYRNSLLTEAQRKEIEQQFGTRQAELEKAWNEHYSRVAFIPGAWENMHPELAPFADMTSYPDDAAGLEAAIIERLQKSIEIQRQVTDVETAKKWGTQYQVASARIGVLLGKHNQARGARGGKDADTPTIQQLRREFDAQRQRINGIPDAARLLNGEAPRTTTVVSLESSADWQPIVIELQSGDVVRVRNTLNQMSGINPPPPWKSHVFPELIKLLDFEPVRGSAAEALKKGWFGPQQSLQVLDAADHQQDRGFKEMLYEGVSRVPGLEEATIERLAALFPISPGKTVSLLREVGPKAEPVAQKYAGHENHEVRICVCEVLRDIGSQASQDLLKTLAEDSNKSVASKAKEALREIEKPAAQRPHLRNRKSA
ncbi:hypothetical protein Pan44_40940 [Caulifigura coniformis]|uniref:HEAT repeat protein n=1 Tax=Caulifigura coniformis TaxID=2527983 RepID=A0A517SIS6_9PLAN|nr:HEAT repeat domain-containing protein [Caulifigura coniformis]QDT56044.1 hypothetical protein Pan44_40940 [Caulifigura coniformis]